MSSVSVIIPTYNRRVLLTRTLNNLLQQTQPPDEIIVVDDHSSDDTVSFVEKHFSDRVLVISSKGKGPGAARNSGLAVATSEYIKFFDSDDLLTENSLEVQLKFLRQSQKGFITSPYFYAEESADHKWKPLDHVVLNFYSVSKKVPLWYSMMVDNLFITIPGMLFRRDFLKEIGPWREDVTAYEDWDFLFRMSLLEPNPAHANECAFLYRLHERQTTSHNFTNQQRDFDKEMVLSELYAQFIVNDNRFNTFVKLCFQNKFFQTYRVTPVGHPLKDKLKVFNTVQQRMVWEVLRLRYKLGRIKTQTNWQPCHGALKSKQQVDHYLSLIH